MYFVHVPQIWADYPELVAGMLQVEGISGTPNVDDAIAKYSAIARERLANATESELPEIQAWRRAFSRMGLKPTQYRCASEALLRRFRIDGELPRIHPLIDLYNAISVAYAIPIGAFDMDHVAGGITCRYAIGDEIYETFGGEIETPYAGEVIFADEAGYTHTRRWTNRQSGRSAVTPQTTRIHFISEAMHSGAHNDMTRLLDTLASELRSSWGVEADAGIVSPDNPRFGN